eukprot:Sdes_comp23144_c0_seq1m21445
MSLGRIVNSVFHYAKAPLKSGGHKALFRSCSSLVRREATVPRYSPALFSGYRRYCSAAAQAEKVDNAEPISADAMKNIISEDASSSEGTEPPKKELLKETEVVVGNSKQHEFKAETRKLLDIVARSLYSEKEVFLRELISNASDAIEKLRHIQVSAGEVADSELPLSISISVDEKNNTFIIYDSGLGMTEEELINNLGMIAQSGSKAFLEQLEGSSSSAKDNIIGQFGVGFYSAFMVGNKVKVYSKSYKPNSKGYCWSSTGDGSYELAEAEGVQRGTKIIIELKEDCSKFSQESSVTSIIKNYSNFVGFPISLNGQVVNTMQPLWTLSPSQITKEQHDEFYRFLFKAWDSPLLNFHYTTDAPLSIKSLFYIPSTHIEKFGMGRLEPGVNLYCRKVLIQANAKNLLPDWMRFVKGVVDSEDIPLNLSRELLQDSALIRKLKDVLANRLLKFFQSESKKDAEKYNLFYKDFGNFFREGYLTDDARRKEIAPLLRFESSKTEPGKLTSLDEYISRKPEDQKEILYIHVPNRAIAEVSPYYEPFQSKGTEVLFLYEALDDFVLGRMDDYKNVKVESVEATKSMTSEDVSGEDKENFPLLKVWFEEALKGKVSDVMLCNRNLNTPAIIVDHESAAARRMAKMIDPDRFSHVGPQKIEINPSHPLMVGLLQTKETDPETAKLVAEQIYDNALVAAGLLDDSRSMLSRLNHIMEAALKK